MGKVWAGLFSLSPGCLRQSRKTTAGIFQLHSAATAAETQRVSSYTFTRVVNHVTFESAH